MRRPAGPQDGRTLLPCEMWSNLLREEPHRKEVPRSKRSFCRLPLSGARPYEGRGGSGGRGETGTRVVLGMPVSTRCPGRNGWKQGRLAQSTPCADGKRLIRSWAAFLASHWRFLASCYGRSNMSQAAPCRESRMVVGYECCTAGGIVSCGYKLVCTPEGFFLCILQVPRWLGRGLKHKSCDSGGLHACRVPEICPRTR
jgi:hypothetical protein